MLDDLTGQRILKIWLNWTMCTSFIMHVSVNGATSMHSSKQAMKLDIAVDVFHEPICNPCNLHGLHEYVICSSKFLALTNDSLQESHL